MGGCLRGNTLLLERNRQLNIHISSQNSSRKEREQKDAPSKKRGQRSKVEPLSKKKKKNNGLFRVQCRFSWEEPQGLV